MTDKDINKLPQAKAADHALTAVRAALSMIPVAGGPAAELFNAIVTPPLTKRRDEWLNSLAEDLVSLQKKVEGITVESLSNNEAFITAVMHATQAAVRNHQEEKIVALRNAVLHVASNTSPDEDLQMIFLNFIDIATPWHLRILKFLQDPRKFGVAKGITYPTWSMGGVSTVLQHTFPEIAGRRPFYDKIVNDLEAEGLVNGGVSMLHTTMSESGMFAKRTTEMGDMFLAFIE